MKHEQLIIRLLTLHLRKLDSQLASWQAKPDISFPVQEQLELSLLRLELRIIAAENKLASLLKA